MRTYGRLAELEIDELSRRLAELDLFAGPVAREADRNYRRWAFESAALDLALRQAGSSLGEALGREYRRVRFVVSTRLDIRGWLELDPALEFKPSRFGSLSALLDCLDYCAERGIVTYGGGQFELGVGRGQIQALASLFYPESPNDVAPSGGRQRAWLSSSQTSSSARSKTTECATS